jgi:hypothetical protein
MLGPEALWRRAVAMGPVIGFSGFVVIFFASLPKWIEQYSSIQEVSDRIKVAGRLEYSANTVEVFDYIISKTKAYE